jgi:hypothetical protein
MRRVYGPQWRAARACALVALVAGLYCLPVLAADWTVEGRVVGVSDGDTITVLDRAKVQHKIRLSGIAWRGFRLWGCGSHRASNDYSRERRCRTLQIAAP